MGPKKISAHLRTVCNQWCSRRRFGCHAVSCLFKCGGGDDSIGHSLTCKKFAQLACAKLKLDERFVNMETLLLFRPDGDLVNWYLQREILRYVYACFSSFNFCRHGKPLNKRLVDFVLKARR